MFSWPGLHVLNAKGKVPTSETFKLNWLTAAGTWLFVSGVLTALVLRVAPGARAADLRPHAEPDQVGAADRVHRAGRSPT